jgi:hypothetical protein
MKNSIEIKESDAQIFNSICKALLPDIIIYMDNAIQIIQKELPIILETAIINSQEYQSLVSGQLKYEFGIVDAANKIDGLLKIWINNIEYNYQKPTFNGKKINSKFSANLIKADLSDVLYTEYAQMTDTLRGYSLPWLEWLLVDGSKTIIDQFEVQLGPNKYSRTGYAIMRPGQGWSVPSQFAGTIEDNWLTRSIDSVSNEINNLLNKAFIK